MGGPMLVAIHVAVVFSCILIMPLSVGVHMAGALDTSSDSHTAPPPNEHRQHLAGGQIPHRDPDLSIGAFSMGLQITNQDKF